MTGLRIGWATPWNVRSAIAQVAEEVGLELARSGHNLTIIRTETGGGLLLPARPSTWPILHLDDISDSAALRDFDIIVAHIGNYGEFHGALVPRLRDLACIGIFHDAFLAHLAFDWAFRPGGGQEEELRSWVWETYGPESWPRGEPYLTDATMRQVMAARPMLEWLAAQTIGAVAHSGFYAERLRKVVQGPVAVTPLPMTFRGLPPPPPPSEEITIAAIGHANANKLLDQLMVGIGASPYLRRRCRVRVIGETTPEIRSYLVSVSSAADVAPPEFTGWVSEEGLQEQLREVDVLSCMRNPVLEGSSASLVLAMTSGRATLVSNHGCYAEVPDDCVLKCRPGAEAFDVMRHLERIVSDPQAAVATGKRGQAFALSHNSPASYAAAIETLFHPAMVARSFGEARSMLRGRLCELELRPSHPAFAHVGETVDSLRQPRKALNDH
ncbi:MAG: glycosyltransferase family protein [Caulobacteraceae bacterium]